MNYQKLKSNITNPIIGGYSDLRLWPCYLTYSSLIFLLAPLIGLTLAATIVTLPACTLALHFGKKQKTNERKAFHAKNQQITFVDSANSKYLALEVNESENNPALNSKTTTSKQAKKMYTKAHNWQTRFALLG
jgi:hypothetical protein